MNIEVSIPDYWLYTNTDVPVPNRFTYEYWWTSTREESHRRAMAFLNNSGDHKDVPVTESKNIKVLMFQFLIGGNHIWLLMFGALLGVIIHEYWCSCSWARVIIHECWCSTASDAGRSVTREQMRRRFWADGWPIEAMVNNILMRPLAAWQRPSVRASRRWAALSLWLGLLIFDSVTACKVAPPTHTGWFTSCVVGLAPTQNARKTQMEGGRGERQKTNKIDDNKEEWKKKCLA